MKQMLATQPSSTRPGDMTSHKLPCVAQLLAVSIAYVRLTRGEEYTDQGHQYYEQCNRERVLRQLKKRARQLGFELTPNAQPASIPQ